MTDTSQHGRERPSAESSATRALEVEGLTHSFGAVDVLSDASFGVEEGTVAALVGPNGSGKTTLLRAILGLLDPDAGSVRLPPPAPSGRRIGYLPQSPSFRPAFTVAETLGFYADLLDGEADVDATLDRVGLSAVRDRRVDALSGGMTRLLGVGQAILGDPPLVVLDEPTGDLDPRMTEYIFEVAADLADDGTTVLLATHNLTGAAEADAVAVLDRGRIVGSGPPAELAASVDAASLREAFLALTAREDGEDGDPSIRVRTRGGEES
ncbi:ABC transporter ATP-binding protein [Halorussus salilacus]|uniref:ABC transporter ATP-binding protein n=1 Tax=Halorussus salilacus TaxID=2953750 RepID=UPI0020A0B8C7|nr:ABC transporter ATP-binding protein [Halorussus salilacus]USZ69486.1 ABC transporter ATP-binding protein [Halorussus salilacus]